MCGELHFENMKARIGSLIDYTNPQTGESGRVRWLGHARVETPLKRDLQEVVFLPEVHSYTEKGVLFQVPTGHVIEAILTTRETLPGGRGVFVRTRPATSSEKEKCLHPRHPKFLKRGG